MISVNTIREDLAAPSHYRFAIAFTDLAVETGDWVNAGTPLSSAICSDHAPVAGRVHVSGLPGTMARVLLEADAQSQPAGNGPVSLQPLAHWQQETPEILIQRIAAAGIRGLGGGAYPTHLKLDAARAQPVEQVIANGVECETGIQCDRALWSTSPETILNGLDIVCHILQPAQCTLALGDQLQAPAQLPGFIKLRQVDHTTPAVGEERHLIKLLTGRALIRPEHPTDHGFICLNISTLHAIHEAVVLGRPLTHRIVTLPDGNFRIAIGHPIEALNLGEEIRLGGRWSGQKCKRHSAVTKGTNAIWPAPEQSAAPCIRCGRCRDACPEALLPDLLLQRGRSVQSNKATTEPDPLLKDLGLSRCMECGLCDATCPSSIALVQEFRDAKTQQSAIVNNQQRALRAKLRHEGHQRRADALAVDAEHRRLARLRRNKTW